MSLKQRRGKEGRILMIHSARDLMLKKWGEILFYHYMLRQGLPHTISLSYVKTSTLSVF